MMGEEIRLYSLGFGWLCSQEGGREEQWATAGHTTGRLSEPELCITGAEKVGVLSYLAYGLLLEDIFIKRIRTAFQKQVYIATI